MLLHTNIQSLHDLVSELTLSLEVSLQKCISLFHHHSIQTAQEMKNRESLILHLIETVEKQSYRMLLQQYPDTNDLIYIIMIIKVSQHLRRMNKYITNCADNSIIISAYSVQIQTNLLAMAEKAQALVSRSLKILNEKDAHDAKMIGDDDNKINSMRRYFKDLVIELTTKEPWKTTEFLKLIDIVRHLERLGDMAANIAEEILFLSSIECFEPSQQALIK